MHNMRNMRNMRVMCVMHVAKEIQQTFSQVWSIALCHPHPWQESAGDTDDTTTRTK
jgi:hypothetical protein